MIESPPRTLTTTTQDDALDALFTLLAAVCAGHIRWPEGTRGHREAKHAIKQAREVLLRSKWRVQTAELRTPGAAQYQPILNVDGEMQP